MSDIPMFLHLPLESAFLCECGAISTSAVRCPACGSEHGLLNLARVLNRESNEERKWEGNRG